MNEIYEQSQKVRIKNLEARFLKWLEIYNHSHITGEEREKAYQFFKKWNNDQSSYLAWVKPAFYFDEDSESLLHSFRSISIELTNGRIAELEAIKEESKTEDGKDAYIGVVVPHFSNDDIKMLGVNIMHKCDVKMLQDNITKKYIKRIDELEALIEKSKIEINEMKNLIEKSNINEA
jgi:hypothetical protein